MTEDDGLRAAYGSPEQFRLEESGWRIVLWVAPVALLATLVFALWVALVRREPDVR